jgi:hypothetical protein
MMNGKYLQKKKIAARWRRDRRCRISARFYQINEPQDYLKPLKLHDVISTFQE